jgi:hypothetical protein
MDLRGSDRPRPVLPYVECHIVENINQESNRCGHFSPLAGPQEADPVAFERDMRQLASRFANIKNIRLMGGEPTLHPKLELFVEAARAAFPNADLRIVTNGLRLKIMHEGFWETCRRANVELDLSLYPVMDKAFPTLEQLCEQKGIKLNVVRQTSFMAFVNPKGDSNPAESMTYCRKMFYCPFLKNSRLHVCALPAVIGYYNDRFGQSIPGDAGIDIFDTALDGHQILERLQTPVATCRFCSCSWSSHPWERASNPSVKDYETASS